MPLYRPSELAAFLDSIGHKPKRTLSQNYLIDGNIVVKIISAVMVSSPSVVVEIGPGPGVLAEALLERGVSVIAIEKDDAFAHSLSRLDPTASKLKVVASDVLECSLQSLLEKYNPKEVAVVSNLPYHLTTPILHFLLARSHLFSSAVLMMQDEVASRLMSRKSSFIGCCTAFFTEAQYAFKVPRACFWPKPKVDSAVVTLRVQSPPLPPPLHKPFFEMLRRAFAGRRKTVLHSLLQNYSREKLIGAFDQIGLCHATRPEEIPLPTWVALMKQLVAKDCAQVLKSEIRSLEYQGETGQLT